MREIEFDCKKYDWTSEEIIINKKTMSHMNHYINNDLTGPLVCVNKLLKLSPDSFELNTIKEGLDGINEYMKIMTKRVDKVEQNNI